jgi:hypothetical protein
LSCAIAEKELLKSEAEICGTVTLELCPPLGVPDPELLHAAATTAMLAATATQAIFLVTCCKETTRLVLGRMRPPFITGPDCEYPQRLHLAEL